jgi:hypothetical protein
MFHALNQSATTLFQEGEMQGAMSAIALALTMAFVGLFFIPWLLGIGR